ncbi:MAG: ribonuclease P protein component [Akkermansia sp.]
MRLTRKQSMTRAYEFAKVRKLGASTAGRFLVLSAIPLPNPDESSRFGIICTKKVGGAVVRNLLKRRVRELLRSHGDRFSCGYHLVCILRWRAVDAPYTDLERDWYKASTRLQKMLKSWTPEGAVSSASA